MSYLYCQNTDCGAYLGSLGGSSCNLCGWQSGRASGGSEELDEFIYQLENNIERAESPDWTVLCLNVQQGENLLRLIRERIQAT